jgi:hypothetical protein
LRASTTTIYATFQAPNAIKDRSTTNDLYSELCAADDTVAVCNHPRLSWRLDSQNFKREIVLNLTAPGKACMLNSVINETVVRLVGETSFGLNFSAVQ